MLSGKSVLSSLKPTRIIVVAVVVLTAPRLANGIYALTFSRKRIRWEIAHCVWIVPRPVMPSN